MQIHILDDTHWVIKFEGTEKYDILHIAKKMGLKATDLLSKMLRNVIYNSNLKLL